MTEQCVSSIQQWNVFLLVLLALFDLALVRRWLTVRSAVGITQAWTISLLKGLLLGNVPVKPAQLQDVMPVFNDDSFAKFSPW